MPPDHVTIGSGLIGPVAAALLAAKSA